MLIYCRQVCEQTSTYFHALLYEVVTFVAEYVLIVLYRNNA
jgi:hypothetical protein